MFRPCIDLHEGKVKQIVGGSLSDDPATLQTNYISPRSSAWYAALYKSDNLRGGHLIMLGPGNERAAVEALEAFPGGLQIGGGLNKENVRDYLNRGASHVIVTSALFQKDKLHLPRLKELSSMVGKEKLVVDLSCRRRGADYWVVMDRWQTFTDLKLDPETFGLLGKYCDEFLVHAADVEGLCQGIDLELVQNLAAWTTRPTTYAGGAKSLDDLILGTRAGKGKIDITIGSALDIFGGSGVRYRDVVRFNRKAIAEKSTGVKGAGN